MGDAMRLEAQLKSLVLAQLPASSARLPPLPPSSFLYLATGDIAGMGHPSPSPLLDPYPLNVTGGVGSFEKKEALTIYFL